MKRYAAVGLLVLTCSPVAMAASPGSSSRQACSRESGDYKQAVCYETRLAHGAYQEVVDDIEVNALGLDDQEKYFLGMAYFGLSNRTGAQGLRCFYLTRAKNHLDGFLTSRQRLYSEQRSLGTSSEVKYTYTAARALTAANETPGCEDSGESLAALERHGRRFLTERVKDLFYKYRATGATLTGLDLEFRTKMELLEGTVRQFVGDASRAEHNYGLILGELESGKKMLEKIAKTANDTWRPSPGVDIVSMTSDPTTGFPSFAFTNEGNAVVGIINQQAQFYRDLRSPTGRLGKINEVVTSIYTEAHAQDLAGYMDMRAKMIEEATQVSTALLRPSNQVTDLMRTPGVSAVSKVTFAPSGGLTAMWSKIESDWKAKKPGCSPSVKKWYCQ